MSLKDSILNVGKLNIINLRLSNPDANMNSQIVCWADRNNSFNMLGKANQIDVEILTLRTLAFRKLVPSLKMRKRTCEYSKL